MARTDPQLNFRIPTELKERLEAAAAENKRSLTGELIARLEQSFTPPELYMDGGRRLTTAPTDWPLSKQEAQEIFAKLAQEAQEVSELAKILGSMAKGFTVSFEDEADEPFPAPQLPAKSPKK